MANHTVRDLMTSTPVCCHPTESVRRAAQLMVENDCGALPVAYDAHSQQLVGMITDRDIACSVVARGRDPNTCTVGEVMTDRLISCAASDNIETCVRAMRENQIRRVPVVDERGACVGIVALADVALKLGDSSRVHETVAAISRPSEEASVPRAA